MTSKALATQFIVVVYNRFHLRRSMDLDGAVSELPETEPVVFGPLQTPAEFVHFPPPDLCVSLDLYCNTCLDGRGYHYECITPDSYTHLTLPKTPYV